MAASTSTSNPPNVEKDKINEKKILTQIKHVPKDAQVIMSILKELGVYDYEPRVVNQLLEFTYRYVTCILDDAKIFANHAKKKTIDIDDVRLACEMVLDKSFTSPPPRHVLTKLAEVRNCMPLPPIKPHCGLRLPPDRYCLTATNYKLRSGSGLQLKTLNKSALGGGRSTIKTQIKPQVNAVTKRGPPPLALAKCQITTIPKPVFKFSSQNKEIGVTPTPKLSSSLPPASVSSDIKMEVDQEDNNFSGNNNGMGVPSNSLKREREEDDFEIVP